MARLITRRKSQDQGRRLPGRYANALQKRPTAPCRSWGITGTGGGEGKSSLVDEWSLGSLTDSPKIRGLLFVVRLAAQTGGSCWATGYRLNSLGRSAFTCGHWPRGKSLLEISMRSMNHLIVKAAGFDLVIVETAGIGRATPDVVPLVVASCTS